MGALIGSVDSSQADIEIEPGEEDKPEILRSPLDLQAKNKNIKAGKEHSGDDAKQQDDEKRRSETPSGKVLDRPGEWDDKKYR